MTIGHHTNIQDGAIVSGQNEYSPPVEIGSYVSVGHGAIIKGAKIGDHSLVGINAVISEGSKVGHAAVQTRRAQRIHARLNPAPGDTRVHSALVKRGA